MKTNAMRILDRLGITYEHYTYECGEFVDGVQIANLLGLAHEKVYKTLVTVSGAGQYYVFVIPVAAELDLKKAAGSVDEKSLSMLPVKEISHVTGYIRGGCTAIGMKKQYQTRIEIQAVEQERIIVSGGRLGSQIELKPMDLKAAANAEFADLILS